MVRHIIVGHLEYYEIYDPITNSVGEMFSNWRDIPQYKAKLVWQIERDRQLQIKYGRCETMR